jgi:divalent metal cation (Fe/Co/Zn/Cd) transporter
MISRKTRQVTAFIVGIPMFLLGVGTFIYAFCIIGYPHIPQYEILGTVATFGGIVLIVSTINNKWGGLD